MDAGTLGKIGELKAQLRLLELGWQVFMPVCDHRACDMIGIDPDGNIHRIQIKSSTYKGNSSQLCWRIISAHSRSESGIRRDNLDRQRQRYLELDTFILYHTETGKLYKIPVSEWDGRAALYLSIREGHPQPHRINMAAEDYEL